MILLKLRDVKDALRVTWSCDGEKEDAATKEKACGVSEHICLASPLPKRVS
jgi:hypothetical protein